MLLLNNMVRVIDLDTFISYDNEDPEDTARAKALIAEHQKKVTQEPPVKLWDKRPEESKE
jgi:hypothetical protein